MLDNLIRKSLYTITLILCAQMLWAQEDESIPVISHEDSLFIESVGVESFRSKSKLDPDKAAVYAAVLPGLGQIYNKQYWKLPIVYSGAILIGHFIKYNHDYYNAFRNAWIAETDGDDSTVNPFPQFNSSSLQRNAERFQRDRDFMIIIGAAYYLLTIVDAHVAAHLIEFDINDELAILPAYQPQTQFSVRTVGVSLVLNLSK
ncbi:DUF5683 domain-containing protein [Reichenbachiella ulvae]|uniref:DUF5683 domain-containing protein n=1 Tax=Reichenbachiella ulvae TaxID=2980104 RepID=A0ABT3CR52_9BACT|nr:DUF5683 domain-containing protein [Reichenbachiella ulvae]MCV9386048.1 DUF5683 domain-containing protein [Reichenbachiella ulvae]